MGEVPFGGPLLRSDFFSGHAAYRSLFHPLITTVFTQRTRDGVDEFSTDLPGDFSEGEIVEVFAQPGQATSPSNFTTFNRCEHWFRCYGHSRSVAGWSRASEASG